MLDRFVVLPITSSPIADETEALLVDFETAYADAEASAGNVQAAREACRDSALALATVIHNLAGLVDPDPFVERVLGIWRTLDAIIARRGMPTDKWSPGSDVYVHLFAQVRALNCEVAQQLAFDTQP